MANLSILDGRLTADPELKQTPNGVSVTSFTIAVDRAFTPKGGEKQTDFIDIVAWRKTAEFICRYFSKGRWIQIIGSIQTRKYVDKDGKNRKVYEVIANEAHFVGDKPKGDDTQTNANAAYPPPASNVPADFDPYAGTASAPPPAPANNPTGTRFTAPVYEYAGVGGFQEFDDDGDLPF